VVRPQPPSMPSRSLPLGEMEVQEPRVLTALVVQGEAERHGVEGTVQTVRTQREAAAALLQEQAPMGVLEAQLQRQEEQLQLAVETEVQVAMMRRDHPVLNQEEEVVVATDPLRRIESVVPVPGERWWLPGVVRITTC
jgi:hypothetical protein